MSAESTLTPAERDAMHYLYAGGEEEIVCQSMRWVVTRFSHECFSVLHRCNPPTLPKGSRMVLERARVDGKFGSCYTCADCVQKTIAELRER
jgi:hypothetical protein